MTTATRTRRAGLPEITRPTSVESVTFRDGMIVTAEDLAAAQRYPESLLHTVLRAYLGCGVVCGLTLRRKKDSDWVVCVEPGVAIDCHGHPVELCSAVEIDLSPDPCDNPPDTVCVAIRRTTSDEAAHDPCTCDVDAPRFDCRRVRDHVIVKTFTADELKALPAVCERTSGSDPCAALTACSPCTCGECWVLLGCVSLVKDTGITDEPDLSGQRWVKPVEALCAGLLDRVATLEKAVAGLTKQPATPAAAKP